MYNGDVVNTARAAESLGCSRPRVIQLIREKVITSAYMGAPDGHCGRSGYKISVDELYELAHKREEGNRRRTSNNAASECAIDREAIKKALTDMQACLRMLHDTIDELKGAL